MSTSTVNLETNICRIVIALLLGAMLGGAILSAQYAASLYHAQGASYFVEYGALNTFRIFVLASVIWFICISVFGGPCWYILHQEGYRSWATALIAGVSVPFVALLVMIINLFTGVSSARISSSVNGVWHWQEGYMTNAGWLNALELSTGFAIQGGIVALVIWRVAYTRTT